jgi:hypothetical protein
MLDQRNRTPVKKGRECTRHRNYLYPRKSNLYHDLNLQLANARPRTTKVCDTVPACPSTNPVEQPIDLFFNRPAHTTLLRVGIKAWPIGPLVGSLFNRPQRENYACSVAK